MKNEKRNLDNINKLAPNTKKLALKWYDSVKKEGIEILIYSTIRTIEEQKANVEKGVSWTMKSYHIVGQALDWVLIDSDGKAEWGAYGSKKGLKVIELAEKIGFESGHRWKKKDSPHLQYEYKGYGTDKKVVVTKKYHTVVSGDTVSEIAVKHKTTIDKIKKLNPGINVNVIKLKQKIRVK